MQNNKIYTISATVIVLVACLQLFTFSKKVANLNFDESLYYVAKSHPLPKQVKFCNELVPLESRDIRERLDKEIIKNAYWHSSILLYYKRAGKFFPIIEPILKKNKIPNDFKYLVIAESGLKNVVSPAGAKGYWQFMEKTGIEFGLEINKEVDERYNLEKSTQAACDYLNDAYKKFGSWTLVAASYNMGMYGLEKNLNRQQVSNYYDLLLNSETARYVFRIITYKLILEHPEQYGFNLHEHDRYSPVHYKTITIDTTISNLATFAKQQGINYKILKLGNPWLRQRSLKNPNKKRYHLHVLTKDFYVYTNDKKDSIDSLNDYQNNLIKPIKSVHSDSTKNQ